MGLQRKVIKAKYLPTRLPIVGTVTTLLALSYWNAPGWLYGVFITLLVMIWLLVIFALVFETGVKPSEVE